MRLLIQGDSHGRNPDILPKIAIAGENKIQHLLVAGDFGLWTHEAVGHEFLDAVNANAEANNLTVYVVGGNHENWDHWNWFVENMPTSKGFAMVRRRVLLAPKAHRWTWAGKQFIGAGGAVSIDKDWRRAAEQGRALDSYGHRTRAHGDRTLWWPDEELKDSDVATIATWGKCDYLITHDCSNYTPWKSRLKPDMDSQIHRQRIDEVLKTTQPKMHFHGHMHENYDWINEYSGGGSREIGLAAFNDRHSWGVLDLNENKWFWPDEFYDAKEDRARRKAESLELDSNF